MPSPPIQVFLTTIASQPALRSRQEYILRILQVKKLPFTSYDLASDEDAKKLWRRKAPNDKQQLPGILVGGRFPGQFSDFEDAVEHDELSIFLRLNDDWDPEIDGDGKELKPAAPVGVPGAASPMQMRPDHKPSFAPQRSPLARHTVSNRRHADDPEEYDAGDKLDDKALAGLQVTEDELMQLVADLGLGGIEREAQGNTTSTSTSTNTGTGTTGTSASGNSCDSRTRGSRLNREDSGE
ncbi:hypothetical protein BKA62DRAFT_669754 [Auriculariales sp. MPI-PUGE-AT-0066]|nr:hypothetical protein BKA62DRAFT_669754 [Auriculariales sp. MPI-PUGE-AT-0066]